MKEMQNYFRKAMGQRIKDARINRYNGTVTQKEMAAMVGVAYRTYQNWEMGIRLPRNKMHLIKLANLLKVDPRELEYGPTKGKFRLNPELKDLLNSKYQR